MIHQVVSIVAAYVSHNSIRAADLPEFIGAVHASVLQLAKSPDAGESRKAENPAVPIKRSVTRDHLVCLEDGKKFKSLRRHLSSFHGLTPEEYRAKWSLPSDYPMVAPAYSATRSKLAKDSGLGQISRAGEQESSPQKAEAPPPSRTDEPKKAKRGRPRKES
jgi:predicted transcriptional regulator